MASVPVLKGGTVQAPLYLIERKTVHKTDDDAAMGNSDGFAQYVFRVVHVFQHGEQSCVIEFFIVEREMFRAAQLEFSPVPQPFPRHVEQVSTGIKPRDIKSIVPEHLQKDTRSTPYVQKRMPAPGPLRDQVLKKAVFLSDGIGSLRRCIPVMQELGCFGVPHLCLHVLYS